MKVVKRLMVLKMTNKKTIRFYTSSGLYKSWEYYDTNKIAKYSQWRKDGNSLKMDGKTYGATIKLKFIGIDYWSRPVFKNVNNNIFYGSTNLLFPENATEKEVLDLIHPVDICYFGREFGCEPMGSNPVYPIEFVKSESI